jgi:hypothetical protein
MNKKKHCDEKCRTSIWTKNHSSGWIVEVEQGGYYDESAFLHDANCCPRCMRRLLSDGTTLVPETWRQEVYND